MTFEDVLKYFTHENLVKVALYVAEDTGIDENTKLVRQWLKDKITGMQEIPLHRVSNYASYYALCVTKNGSFYSAANAIRCAIWHFQERKEEKEREYEKYIGFFSRKKRVDFVKMFDIDDTTDLNVLLDFLTDNYPETFDEFSREDFLTKKIAKEYLKVIYQ